MAVLTYMRNIIMTFVLLLLSAAVFAQDGRICLNNYHTGEILDVTYKVKGRYDDKAAAQIKDIFRSRSDDKEIDVDIKLIELLDDIQRHFGADCLELISGYRSPELNRQLKIHGANVAEESMHLEGKAADVHIDEATEEAVAEYARGKKLGGVGYYPAWDFVHIDTGEPRSWNLPDRAGRLLMAFRKSDKWQVFTDKDVYFPGEAVEIQIMNITRTKKVFAGRLVLQYFRRGEWSDVRALEECNGRPLSGGGICEIKFAPDTSDKRGKHRLIIIAPKGLSHLSAMSNEFYIKEM
jgi:uncharacterized protein YcbK (DUF882 family)